MTYPTYPNPRVTWDSFSNLGYDPQEKYGDCPGDLLSIINDERIPADDRIWAFAVCTELDDNAKRIFAVRCVRETPLSDGRKIIDLLTDHRLIEAVEVAHKHAIGEATDLELNAARAAADDAQIDAATSTAWDATREIARYVVWDTAEDATWAAHTVAAEASPWEGLNSAERSAAWDAGTAARAAARAAQIEIIKSMFLTTAFILRRVNISFDGTRQKIETCTVFDAVQEQDQIRFIRENGQSGYCFDSEGEQWELEEVCS